VTTLSFIAVLNITGLPISASLNELFHALPTYRGWKSGYKKIQMCCQTAFKLGYAYIWIDTCCINKKSSSELSEAINSMLNNIKLTMNWNIQPNVIIRYVSVVLRLRYLFCVS
jgi:hypothetical protein